MSFIIFFSFEIIRDRITTLNDGDNVMRLIVEKSVLEVNLQLAKEEIADQKISITKNSSILESSKAVLLTLVNSLNDNEEANSTAMNNEPQPGPSRLLREANIAAARSCSRENDSQPTPSSLMLKTAVVALNKLPSVGKTAKDSVKRAGGGKSKSSKVNRASSATVKGCLVIKRPTRRVLSPPSPRWRVVDRRTVSTPNYRERSPTPNYRETSPNSTIDWALGNLSPGRFIPTPNNSPPP